MVKSHEHGVNRRICLLRKKRSFLEHVVTGDRLTMGKDVYSHRMETF